MLDQSVATTVHLTNISSAFFPSAFTRAPVCEIDDTLPSGEQAIESIQRTETGDSAESEYRMREGEMTIAEEIENEDPVELGPLIGRWSRG